MTRGTAARTIAKRNETRSQMSRYIEVIFRFRVRFAILLLVAPATAAIATVILFPSYKAVGRLWIDNTSYFGASPTGWSQYLTPAQNESDSLNQLRSTRAFSADLDERLKASMPNTTERRRALATSNFQLAPIGSHLIMVSAACETPSVCAAIVNAGVDVLRAEEVQLSKDQAKAAIDFLNIQLADARQQEQTAQDALQQYVLDHPGVKIDPTNAGNGLEVSRLVNNVTQARDKVTSIDAQLNHDKYVASVSSTVYQAGPRVIDSPAITRGGLIGDGAGVKKAGAAAGGILAVGLTYLVLLGFFDKTARETREIERRFNVRVVATIPRLSSVERLG